MAFSINGLWNGTEIFDSTGPGKNIYRVIQKLGKGGNGVAYLVHCHSGKLAGNFFTLKFLSTTDKERKNRFLKEIQFIKEYRHPSVLNHYDEGVFNDYPFVVTEYLRHTLYDILNDIELKEALIYSVQLLSAVKFLQDNDYVHRDIKPKNVFLDNSNAVLGDFGLIKNMRDTEVHADDIEYVRDAMPIHYRTPQLVRYLKEGELSKKTDIFQMGLVLYEIFYKSPALRQSKNKEDEIDDNMFENKNRRIKSKKYRDKIEPIIWNMLSLDESEIKSTDDLLKEFQEILYEYIAEVQEIEFKVIF